MRLIDNLVLKCRHLLRTSLKRILFAVALGLAFTIFMLVPLSREANTIQGSRTVHPSRYIV
jgi:hypothetical protein